MTTYSQILNAIAAVLRQQLPEPVAIGLALPIITKKGKLMANFEIKCDTVATIPITVLDPEGAIVPAPTGDVFTAVVSDATKLGVTVNASPAAIVLTPLVQQSPDLTVTVTDSAGLSSYIQIVDIVFDLTPSAIGLDTTGATTAPQPVPAAVS